jgi:hypothetical protein
MRPELHRTAVDIPSEMACCETKGPGLHPDAYGIRLPGEALDSGSCILLED